MTRTKNKGSFIALKIVRLAVIVGGVRLAIKRVWKMPKKSGFIRD